VNPFPDELVDTNDVLQADHDPFCDRLVERDTIEQQLGICRQESQTLGDRTGGRCLFQEHENVQYPKVDLRLTVRQNTDTGSTFVHNTEAINITSTFIVKHEQSSAHNEVSERLTWVLDVKHRYGYRQNVIVWVNK
jgi:hypothetical protein